MKINSIDAAVLSGGKNSRMKGKNKAFIKLNRKRMLDNALEILASVFARTIIVTNAPEDYSEYGQSSFIITDIIKDVGPIGGVHAALSYTDKQGVFFIACDMPNTHNDIIIRRIIDMFLLGHYDAVIPRGVKGVEPLFGVYAKTTVGRIEEYIKEGQAFSLRRFLERIDAFYLDVNDAGIFCNINTSEDIRIYENKEQGLDR